ncbi:hypothetical protein [Armatimonas sp.]|uniref:hypothetical protein n=1 Tax=Armatimonas sp. TaxID=1872638 RepID=UPI00286B00F6|nr:hypothetical protein [Armatimonas sp.]
MPLTHTFAVLTDEAENRLINALIGLVVALTWWLRAQPKFRSARRRALRRLREKRKRKDKASADNDEDHSGKP